MHYRLASIFSLLLFSTCIFFTCASEQEADLCVQACDHLKECEVVNTAAYIECKDDCANRNLGKEMCSLFVDCLAQSTCEELTEVSTKGDKDPVKDGTCSRFASCLTACEKETDTNCKGSCVDLQSNNANCGACGTVCLEDEECIQGKCIPVV